MFFFIGGIQPRTVRLEKRNEACPYCGHFEVNIKRTDHYLSLFFIPLIRVKKGMPYAACDSCQAIWEIDSNIRESGERRCASCGRVLAPEFSYCPYCGQSHDR